MPSAVFQGTEISLHGETRDTELNGHAKVQFLVSCANESRLCGHARTVFPWSPKRNILSHLILKLSRLLLRLCQPAVLTIRLMGQHVLRISHWFSPRSTSYRNPSHITTCATSPPLDEDSPVEELLVVVPSFAHHLSCSTLFSKFNSSNNSLANRTVSLFLKRNACGNEVK